jgi:hypothetical protein
MAIRVSSIMDVHAGVQSSQSSQSQSPANWRNISPHNGSLGATVLHGMAIIPVNYSRSSVFQEHGCNRSMVAVDSPRSSEAKKEATWRTAVTWVQSPVPSAPSIGSRSPAVISTRRSANETRTRPSMGNDRVQQARTRTRSPSEAAPRPAVVKPSTGSGGNASWVPLSVLQHRRWAVPRGPDSRGALLTFRCPLSEKLVRGNRSYPQINAPRSQLASISLHHGRLAAALITASVSAVDAAKTVPVEASTPQARAAHWRSAPATSPGLLVSKLARYSCIRVDPRLCGDPNQP